MRLRFEDFMCKVCNNVFKYPSADSCGHTFCRKCLFQLINAKSNCPIQNSALNASVISKNYAVSQILDGAVKFCDNENNGCRWNGNPRRFYRYHKKHCLFVEFKQAIIEALKDNQLKHALNYKLIELGAEVVFEGIVDANGEPEFGIEYLNGQIVYEGSFLNRHRHGIGTLYLNDTTMFQGQFIKGRIGGLDSGDDDNARTGFAVKYVSGKPVAEGFWKNNKLNGLAYALNNDGSETKCEFQDDIAVVPMKIRYPSGRIFKGILEEDQMKEGMLIEEDNMTNYKGSFVNNLFDGQGRLHKFGKFEYIGQFKAGQFEGIGSLESFELKTKFEGEFKNGKKHGQGVLIKLSGSEEFRGTFVQGQFTGKGVHIRKSSGLQYEGNFENGWIISPCKITYQNGRVYTGEIEQRQPHGKGTMRFPNGDVYSGKFDTGEMVDSSGKMTYANGDVYQGFFKRNERRGEGTFTYSNGDKFTGVYINDLAEGQGKLVFADGSFLTGYWAKNKLHGFSKLYERNKLVAEIIWEKGVAVEEKSVNQSNSAKDTKPIARSTNNK
jgi:hypothetical protein